jgi:hypothetical protein
LAKYDYAMADCDEAITNKYKIDKFVAFKMAIIKFTETIANFEQAKINFLQRYKSVDVIQMNLFFDILGSSKKLLKEASSFM